MSAYWTWDHRSGVNYHEYLRQSRFMSDVIGSQDAAAKQIAQEMSLGTREVLGGLGDLGSQLKQDLASIEAGMDRGFDALGATFTWGFSEMLTALGGMHDSLQTLLKIASTPAQTAAFEQYAIARDANRQGLLAECLEALGHAIDGVPGLSPGYKLEWRFHQLRGKVLLGSFENHDAEVLDAPEAEKAFLKRKNLMHYDLCLKAGTPIASGVIEGACRTLIGDRLDITGARWSVDGAEAEAVLKLRALAQSRDFDEYWTFHIEREYQRHHASKYADDKPPGLVLRGFKPSLRAVK